MDHLRLIAAFIRNSAEQDLAYRANFWINLLHSLLNLVIGILGLNVLFSQVASLNGWSYGYALALLGVFLFVSALRGLFIGPSLEALAGMGQEIATGNFDFILLRPLNVQFLVTFRRWNLFSLLDLGLGVVVIISAVLTTGDSISLPSLAAFCLALTAGAMILYAILLAMTALVFWSPGFLFTWVFDALFQLARYPVDIYPPGLRLILTWGIPVGMMTTIPARALQGNISPGMLAASMLLAGGMLVGASWLFRQGVRHYASASS